jgi:polar amino acid transport system substrate-binding protein
MKPPASLVAAALAALLLSALPAQAAEPVKVVGNNAPPYRIIDGSDFYGIYFDIMAEIARRAGIALNLVEAPFKRCLAMMEKGQADIMLGPNKTPEREAFMVFTNATLPPADKAFYMYPGDPPITRYEDLAGKRVAVVAGKAHFPRFDADATLRKVECPDHVAALEKVLTGACDVAVLPEMEGDYVLLRYNLPLVKSPFTVPGMPSYIAIARNSPALALRTSIEQALAEMVRDGTLAAIVDRYR